MPTYDRSALVRMVLEGLAGLLVGLLAWTVNGIKSDVTTNLAQLHQLAITVEGIKSSVGTLNANVERIDTIQRRNSELIMLLQARYERAGK